MGDIPGTDNVTIWDDEGDYSVNVTALNRLSVDAAMSFDSDINALIVIDTIQEKIRLGKFYCFSDYTTNIGSGSNRDYLMTIPAGIQPHTICSIISTKAGVYYIYESPTTSANGTSMSVYNNSRNSANTTSVTIYKSPTVTATGTQLLVGIVSTNTMSSFSTSEAGFDIIKIFKENTNYLIRFTSLSSSNAMSLTIQWYE